MRYGFKAEAERRSLALRKELKLSHKDCLPARDLAKHLNICVINPISIPGMSGNDLCCICAPDSGFSAVTLTDTIPPIIIYNNSHSIARQESSIMHEIAHLLEKHEPAGFTIIGGQPMRSFNNQQEEEAEWLGACLQICREGLVWAIKQGMSETEIAEHFLASVQMVQFRRKTTGIDFQLKNTKSKI